MRCDWKILFSIWIKFSAFSIKNLKRIMTFLLSFVLLHSWFILWSRLHMTLCRNIDFALSSQSLYNKVLYLLWMSNTLHTLMYDYYITFQLTSIRQYQNDNLLQTSHSNTIPLLLRKNTDPIIVVANHRIHNTNS